MKNFEKFLPENVIVHRAILDKNAERVWYSYPNENKIYKAEIHKTQSGTWEYSCGY